MPSLEQRLTALEQVRERASVMHVLFAGAATHHGTFIVRTGGKDHTMERTPDETWDAFRARADEHATGILRLAIFMPVDVLGNQLYLNDKPEEEYEAVCVLPANFCRTQNVSERQVCRH